MSGTFFALVYLRMAVFGAVPMVLNRMATCSSSISLRITSTALGGL